MTTSRLFQTGNHARLLHLLIGAIWCLSLLQAHAQRPPPTKEQMDALSLAIKTDPNQAWSYVERGWSYAQLGDESSARADYATAFKLKPGNFAALRSYGWALFDLGHPDEAMTAWHEAATRQKQLALTQRAFAWTTYTFAVGYWSLGQKPQALASYAQAVRQMPDNFRTKKALLRFTEIWTAREQAVITQLFDAWANRPTSP